MRSAQKVLGIIVLTHYQKTLISGTICSSNCRFYFILFAISVLVMKGRICREAEENTIIQSNFLDIMTDAEMTKYTPKIKGH